MIKEKDDDLLVENVIAREIVAEIMSFGVSQAQIIKVINLLALELENRILMENICNALQTNSNSSKKSSANSKLIL